LKSKSLNSRVIVEISKISGRGVFAAAEIGQGERVLTFCGAKVPARRLPKFIQRGLRPDDPLLIDQDHYLIVDPPGYFTNHSCVPNAFLNERGELLAMTKIKRGEEITFDYSTTVAIQDPWTMKCQCGLPACRRVIGNLLSIPTSTLRAYLKSNSIPTFIRSQLPPRPMQKSSPPRNRGREHGL
jgi:SET domain-containing protein